MDFNSLGVNAPFYILHKGEFTLQVGSVKSKTDPKPQFPTQTPGVFAGLNTQPNVVDVIVTLDGVDTPFNNLPFNTETAQYNNGDTFVSCSRDATLQMVDSMMQSSRKALEQRAYHEKVLSNGEVMLETLNPQYAENKRQVRTIEELKSKQRETDEKLSGLAKQNSEILSILRKLDGDPRAVKS